MRSNRPRTSRKETVEVPRDGYEWTRCDLLAIWITQRPQLLDPTCYKTAVYKFFFRLDPADINYSKRKGVTIGNIKEDHGFDLRVS